VDNNFAVVNLLRLPFQERHIEANVKHGF
jgi:hypothetical protein